MLTKQRTVIDFFVYSSIIIIVFTASWGTFSHHYFDEIRSFTNWENYPITVSIIETLDVYWFMWLGITYLAIALLFIVHVLFNKSLSFLGRIIMAILIYTPPGPYVYWYLYVKHFGDSGSGKGQGDDEKIDMFLNKMN